jgi:hypothetical protein
MPLGWGDRPEEEGLASAGELPQPVLIDRTSSPPRRIPAVGVEAPAVESSAGAPLPVWGYARWPLPDAPGGWPGWWVPDEPVPRTVLFAAVPATVTFRVSLPVTPAALVFWMGMDPALQAAWSTPGGAARRGLPHGCPGWRTGRSFPTPCGRRRCARAGGPPGPT